MFWIISIAMAVAVLSLLAAPLLRPAQAGSNAPELTIYKGQLAEIDRDIARGVIDPQDADRARTEVSRRLLAASRATHVAGTAPRAASLAVAAGVAALLLGAGGALYLSLGAQGVPDQPIAVRLAEAQQMRDALPDQATLEAGSPPALPVDAPAEYLAQVDQLRTMVPTRPDDLQGWTLLAFHETRLGNYAAAARAQDRVVALKGDNVATEDLVRLADVLAAAANGVISAQTEAIARQLVARDPGNIPGRYYLGAVNNQTLRPDLAFRLWRPLVDSGDTSFHTELARAQIEDAAFRAGETYSLPAARGPDAGAVAAAQDMSEEDRTAMIGGMVNQLAGRLASEGGPAADWARLITAYGVLGESEAASAVWQEAQTTFAGDSVALQVLTTAAQSAGVAE